MASRMERLPLEEQYAVMELFRGTLVRHSAILYRDDYPGDPKLVSFSGEAWLDTVPVRLPDTICVQERLPRGAVAVLINQTHTFTDLFMPINSIEKGWFDAIDGNCKIGDIVEKTSPGSKKANQLVMARRFFERLWLYDQVVFDASSSSLRKVNHNE